MNNLYKRELVVSLIDVFENFLDSKGIKIPNEERDREDAENAAQLYGDDFDDVMDNIIEVLRCEGIDIAYDFNTGEEGTVIRLRNEFYELVAQRSPYLPELAHYVIFTKKNDETTEINTDRTGEVRSWKMFFEQILKEIHQIYGTDLTDVHITGINYSIYG